MFFSKEDGKLTEFARMMKLSGLWFYYDVSPRNRLIQKGIVHVYQFLNIIVQLSAFKVGFKDLYLFSSSGNYFMGMMYIHLLSVLYFKNLGYLNQFVYGMKKIHKNRVSDWEIEIFDEFSSKAWRFIRFVYNILVFFWSIIILFPFVCELVLVALSDSSEPFRQLNFFRSYLPDVNERSLLFYVTLICTYFQIVVGGLFIICMHSMLPASVAYVCAELRVISRKLQRWSEDTINPRRELALTQIIQEHNDILALINIIRKYFGELYISQNFGIPLSITLSLFSINQALKVGNMNLVLEISYTLFGWVMLVFISCYFSQELSDESIRLSDVLYMIPWYRETPQVRKYILVMMLVTKKPIVIDYKGTKPMNLYRFAKIINASYSYFMLLQTAV